MSRLPACSGAAAVRAFRKAGWTQDRQRGSHVTMTKPGSEVVPTIPLHSHLGPGLLRSLIRAAGLPIDEFVALL
jgi:predicted RNA binding protein YcfA (HicA-like mRNA interferase family)